MKLQLTEVCPTCGKISRIIPGKQMGGRVTWRHEYITKTLACGHESANTYDDDDYLGYTIVLVEE